MIMHQQMLWWLLPPCTAIAMKDWQCHCWQVVGKVREKFFFGIFFSRGTVPQLFGAVHRKLGGLRTLKGD